LSLLQRPRRANAVREFLPPDAKGHLRRGALLEALGACHARTPLTWVVGLPGSGKTSAVARWLEESASAAVWYRVRNDDGDGAGWFDAVRTSVADGGKLPVWSPENQIELTDFARRFFAELRGDPLTLVLDDCHRIGDESPLFRTLESFHEVCGPTLRVVLIGRRGPPPSLSFGVVGGWLSVVDDLRLSEEEALKIAAAARARTLDRQERGEIAKADGWLAHVLALGRSPTSAGVLSGDASERVGDFLAAELLASVPVHVRTGLRRLAEVPEIPREGDIGVFVAPEARRLLSTLSTQRYFVDSTKQRFRLHDLLRDALRRRNEAEDSPATLREARRELGAWIGPRMPEAAMYLHCAAGDTDGALALLDRHAASWLSRGLHRAVEGWLHDLPEPAGKRERAALAFHRAQALLPLEPEAARPLFASARRAAAEAKDVDRAYLSWCGEVASYVIQWGAVHGLADLVDALESLHATLGLPAEDVGFRMNADALTALMYGRAEDPRVARFAEATARAITHAPDAGARIEAAAQLLIYKMWWAGDVPGARALYQTFDATVSEGEDLPALPRLLWWSCASIVDWQCGEPSECYRKVDRGLALAESSGIHVRDFFLLTQGIFCALNQDDSARAEQYLARLARTERSHKRLDVMVHSFFRSWYSLGRGDPRTALAHAEAAWPVAEAIGSTFHKVIVLSALGPARVHTGDLEGAERAYRLQLSLAKAANNPTFTFIAFCVGAEIALARGDGDALAKQVERVLFVKHLGGFHSCCGWRTPMMQELLAFALRRQILPEVARQWIRERRIPPPTPVPEGWPMPVRIETGDGLQVKVDGAPERVAPAKSARKLRELIAVLAADPAGAPLADLADWLWPDAEGDKAAASLKVAIHRARQWIGSDAIVVEDGCARLNERTVACDVWRPSDRVAGDPDRTLRGFDAPPIRALRRKLRAR
jgi:hypothetical protein